MTLTPPTPLPLNCLLVEDCLDILQMTERALTRCGFAVTCAESAAEARECFTDPALRLAVIDLGLPDESGEDLVRELRALRPELPILLASGGSQTELQALATDLGQAEALAKPFMGRQLKELAMRMCGLSPSQAAEA